MKIHKAGSTWQTWQLMHPACTHLFSYIFVADEGLIIWTVICNHVFLKLTFIILHSSFICCIFTTMLPLTPLQFFKIHSRVSHTCSVYLRRTLLAEVLQQSCPLQSPWKLSKVGLWGDNSNIQCLVTFVLAWWCPSYAIRSYPFCLHDHIQKTHCARTSYSHICQLKIYL